MRRTHSLALGFLLAAASLAASPASAQSQPPAPAPARYTSLTVFGDSLVDAGNIRALGLGADPNRGYFEGRFTNGYDYTDLLSIQLFGTPTLASLRGGTNFAYGGARASDTTPPPGGAVIRDLNEQVLSFAATLGNGRLVDSTGLYILNFGGNDIFAAAADGTPTGFASDDAFLRNAAAAYARGVQDLNNLGVRNILLTGFPNATPGTQLDYSILAEGYLTDALAGLTLSGETRLLRYSYLSFFQRLQANPAAFGFADGLILPDPALPGGGTCQGANAFPACTNYFSFDGVHPTAAVHRGIFQDLNAQFNLAPADAAVPEPATWVMLIAGFAAVGGVARGRRRRTIVSFG